MELHSPLEAFALAFIVFGILASIVAVGVLAQVAIGNRRERRARRESIRTYDRGLVTTH
jgi:hypothetical protein